MTHPLCEHHRRISAGIAEVRDHCSRCVPNIVALGEARLRLSRLSRVRTKYIHEILLPTLRKEADANLIAQIEDMHRFFAEKRLLFSDHVTTWNSAAIAENWDGYRHAVREVWAMMEDQMYLERTIFSSTSARARLQRRVYQR